MTEFSVRVVQLVLGSLKGGKRAENCHKDRHGDLIWLKKEDDDLCRLHQRSTVAT
jgi:hypothetical protein